jgi:hypothetical protein
MPDAVSAGDLQSIDCGDQIVSEIRKIMGFIELGARAMASSVDRINVEVGCQ